MARCYAPQRNGPGMMAFQKSTLSKQFRGFMAPVCNVLDKRPNIMKVLYFTQQGKKRGLIWKQSSTGGWVGMRLECWLAGIEEASEKLCNIH